MIVEERGRKIIIKESFMHKGPAPAPTGFIALVGVA